MNLVVNARDARPGEFVSLRVNDNGVGMSPEVMERIFEPFYTAKEIGKGTGLGLSSVYGIVKQAAGHIEVKSEPGSGSVFTIHYPASQAARRPCPAPPDAAAMPRTTGTILLAEDEDSVRNFTRLVLESRGYRIDVGLPGGGEGGLGEGGRAGPFPPETLPTGGALRDGGRIQEEKGGLGSED